MEEFKMEDWEHMFHFACYIVEKEIKKPKGNNIFDQRMTIVNFDHSVELFLKSYLLKKGYIINKLYNNKVGIKNNTELNSLLNQKKTIDFLDALDIVSKEANLEKETKTSIKKLHQIRNEIQHRAIDLPLDKKEEIRNFKPHLSKLIGSLFPEFFLNEANLWEVNFIDRIRNYKK